MPMESYWNPGREENHALITPAPCPADVVSIIDNLVHADDLAGRAVDAIGRGDLVRAIGDFEWSLKFHVQAAIRCAQLAEAAEQRGEYANSPALRSQGALLFWHLPGRARIAATLLRAAVAGTDAPDPAESLRFIAEGALRYPEARVVLSEETHERLTSAVRGSFTEPSARFEPRITRVDPPPPVAGSNRPPAPPATPTELSTREREVVCLIAEGLTNRGIGYRLGVKAITINTFVTRIFGKLGVDNRAAAAAHAVRHGLCEG
jgi:DNA-binding NarL/FixJ family response regulator